MKNFRTSFIIVAALIGYSQVSLAWGALAHQAIGEIAARNLTPAAMQTVTNILGADNLAIASSWADQVRDDHDFDSFQNAHFYEIKTGMNLDDNLKLNRNPADAVSTLERVYFLLKDRNVPRSVKMIALRYFIHIIGDLHQPFHVGNTLDKGATLCFAMLRPPQIQNLHSIWDGGLVDLDISNLKQKMAVPKSFYSYADYANEIINSTPLSTPDKMRIGNGTYKDWINESIALRSFIYPDQVKTFEQEKARTYCNLTNAPVFIGPDKAVTLTPEYQTKAIQIIHQRILAAGLRAAWTLNQLFEKEGSAGPNKEMTKQQILAFLKTK